jgi:altronate hydrolase
VTDVLQYGERVRTAGLTLLATPGYDGVSVTALAASGAHLVLFTTGRGTPLGTYVPTLKISSSSGLARRKPGLIDFDAGTLLAGTPMEELAEALLRLVLRTASGDTLARNEENGYRELVIWRDGVTV